MGQCYHIINLDKHQSLDPGRFNDGSRLREFATSQYGTLMALAALLAEGHEQGSGIHSRHEVIGSWAGDRIIILGEYADQSMWDQVDVPNLVDITEHILQALWEDATLSGLMVQQRDIAPPQPQSMPMYPSHPHET